MLEKELQRIIYNLKRIYYYHHNDNGSLDIIYDTDTVKFYVEGTYAFKYTGKDVGGDESLKEIYSEIKRTFPDLHINVMFEAKSTHDMTWKFKS